MKASAMAKKHWEKIPNEVRVKLLNNVWCGTCVGVSGIRLTAMAVEKGDLVLNGDCVKCGGQVARLIETSEMRD